MSKYEPLKRYLSRQAGQIVVCSFAEIETLIEDKLPNSAHVYREWWANETKPDTTHVQCRAWRDAGYSAFPNLEVRHVKFVKAD